MASLLFARRFSSKLLKKTSLYSYSSSCSSSPLSYLTHSTDHFLLPKVSSSISSIFNRHCTSTTQYSKSHADSSSSSSPQLLLNDSKTYFLAGARYGHPSNLNLRVSCEKFESNHKKYLDQLPKELYNITPEEFRRGIKILLKSMGTLRSDYSIGTSLWFLFMGYIMYSFGEANIWFGLYFGSYYVAKLMEIKSIEKVELLRKLQKQGNIPIHTAVLQLINEVKESDRRREVVYAVHGFVIFIMILKFLALISS